MHITNKTLETLLDHNTYDQSQLVELKIPMHLPYQTNWTSYQRFDGEIKLNGIIYRYVKRKVSNDTLFLMCIPNSGNMRLETAKNDFFKLTDDLAQNDNSKKTDTPNSFFKNLQNVYNDSSLGMNIMPPFILNQNSWPLAQSADIIFTPHFVPGQPPDITIS